MIIYVDNDETVCISSESCCGGETEAIRYKQHFKNRVDKYKFTIDKSYDMHTEQLNLNGCHKIESFFDDYERLGRIKQFFNDYPKKKSDFYTDTIDHPILLCKDIFELAFDDKLINLATSYFKCLPSLHGATIRKSKATDIKSEALPHHGQTTLYHCDQDSPRFLKYFVYLTDVGEDNGPFTYVAGTQLNKHKSWTHKLRHSDKEIEKFYGSDSIRKLTGNVGDLVVANTSGFHKGEKVVSGERLLLTFYYGIHYPYWRTAPTNPINQSDFLTLPDWKKPVADFMVKK